MKNLLVLGLLFSPHLGRAVAQDLSTYVPMPDGVRLAVDVHLPEDATLGDPLPVLLELTRYWRSAENAQSGQALGTLNAVDFALLEAGYALVKVDVRGTGASFGTRLAEYGTAEVRDGYALMDWIVAQSWCDGNLGAFGTSYSGTTAELLTAANHPALKAVIPGWSDFDLYSSPARPYGMFAEGLIETWGNLVGWLDQNATDRLGRSVRGVQGDSEGALLRTAIAEHADNVDVAAGVRAAEFRDQAISAGGDSYADASSLRWRADIEASRVPMLVIASWFDAGTVAGALTRWRHFSNPQNLLLMAGSHGGRWHASPYTVSKRPLAPIPSESDQLQLRLDFFDHHLRGEDNGVAGWPAIRYFNLGEEAFRETDNWPPAGVALERFYCAEGNTLSRTAPLGSGIDIHSVDYGVNTGVNNRWEAQMGKPVLNLDRREEMDARMLCYTGPILEQDLQITGTPVVTLRLHSDRTDGAFLVYLEDVAPDGQSRYLSEGGLRAVHRREAANPDFPDHLPYHSFVSGDAQELKPGELFELRFAMQPISVRVAKGHRIRMAIAGADQGNLARIPAAGEHQFALHRNTQRFSLIELPVLR